MNSPRILYFNHDNPLPAGGIKTIYSHVEHLVRNGFNAFVVHHDPAFKPNWFDGQDRIPRLSFRDGFEVYPNDVIVLPEDHAAALLGFRSLPVRKIVFCQNHFYIFQDPTTYKPWRDLGITHVLASSEVIASFIQSFLEWPDVPVIHYAIDHQRFRPAAKELQIAFMSRKNAALAQFLRGLCQSMPSPVANVNWVDIAGMHEHAVAEVLAKSALFVSLSHMEGFGLPPVEAMASGCLVVGYHGHGGLEYATQENGIWCDSMDPIAFAMQLRSVVESMLANRPEISRFVQAGIQTASRYTSQRQETELVEFFRRIFQA